MIIDPILLAREGNGAIQVDESPNFPPPIITLVGPIKVWWSEWDSPRHKEYTEWRDAVRVALIHLGCAVYSPHRAIQGSWNEQLQQINDSAIRVSNLIVVLTPPDVEANGTLGEIEVAKAHGVKIYNCPPSGENGINELVSFISQLIAELYH
jgi:hypothetical protein